MKIVALLVLMATVAQAENPGAPRSYERECMRKCWSEEVSVVVPRSPDDIHIEFMEVWDSGVIMVDGQILVRLYSHAGNDLMQAWVTEFAVRAGKQGKILTCSHEPPHTLDMGQLAPVHPAHDVLWLAEHAVTPLRVEAQQVGTAMYGWALWPTWHRVPVPVGFQKESDDPVKFDRREHAVLPPAQSRCDCAAWFKESDMRTSKVGSLLEYDASFWRVDLGTGEPARRAPSAGQVEDDADPNPSD